MKKQFMCILLAVSVLFMCGCGTLSENPETTEATDNVQLELTPLCDGKTLKVLAIGNSFSDNTTNYLYDIAKAEGMTDVVVGRLYIGACSVQQHLYNATNNEPKYTYSKNNSGIWMPTDNATLLYGLQDEDWDIITLQQNSGNSGLPESYKDCLEQLIAYVDENKTNPDAKLLWHMTWAYQQDSTHSAFSNYASNQDRMYQSICQTVQQVVVPTNAFDAVIPVGTAIQNARTSIVGDTLTIDGYHLNTLGEVIGSYTWYAMFVGKPLEAINHTWVTNNFKLTDEYKAVIIDAVNHALQNPYAVTQSSVSK